MKTVARYLDNNNTSLDGSFVSTFIKPKHVFLNGCVGYDETKYVDCGLLEIDTTLPVVNAFTLTQGADTATAISTIIVASNNDVVDNIYVLISSTITTRPKSIEIKASGARIDGNATSLNVGGLTPNQSYYGWAMAVDKSGNESLIVASTPVFLETDPISVIYSFSIALGTNPDQEISVTMDATDTGTLFVLLSKTQTTPPTATVVMTSGVSLPGTTTSYNFTGLDRGAAYYGSTGGQSQQGKATSLP